MAAIVARVPDRKGKEDGVITVKEFDHALDQVAAADGRKVTPEPGGRDYEKLKHKAIGELLEFSWIRGQAGEMGIGLRPPQVSRELATLKKQAFKNGAQYRRFLKEAHFTRADVRDRVEVQMLSQRIEERIVLGIDSEAAAQKAFSRFVVEYEKRWRSRTVCAPGYVTELCSNGPEPKGR
ncbi:MAG TPA: SurA N-terminal domain-containing protein [Solirubrobacterales bacterium]|nr:SurA N-terminal domain-containing protein [Solirubrobacterales bacterium]